MNINSISPYIPTPPASNSTPNLRSLPPSDMVLAKDSNPLKNIGSPAKDNQSSDGTSNLQKVTSPQNLQKRWMAIMQEMKYSIKITSYSSKVPTLQALQNSKVIPIPKHGAGRGSYQQNQRPLSSCTPPLTAGEILLVLFFGWQPARCVSNQTLK